MVEVVSPESVIQASNKEYFQLVNDLFGNEISQFREKQRTVSQFMTEWRNGTAAEEFAERRNEVSTRIGQFWEERSARLTEAITAMPALKCTVGSDIFPFRVGEKLHAVGCYADTFIVQDYLRRIAISDPRFSERHAAFGLVAYALEVSQREPLFRNDLPLPPLIVFDHEATTNGVFRQRLVQYSREQLKTELQKLFGCTFLSFTDMNSFIDTLVTVDDVDRKIIVRDYALSEAGESDVVEQLRRYIVDARQRIQGFAEHAGKALQSVLLSNVSSTGDQFIRSDLLDGTPLVHGDLEWDYILRQISAQKRPDLISTRAVQQGSETPGFVLRYVNDDQLISLRKEGALHEIRERIRRAVQSIEVCSSADISSVTEEVNREMHSLMAEHGKELMELKASGKRYFGMDLAPMLGVASLIITGAALDSNAINALAGFAGVSGATSIKGVYEKGKTLYSKFADSKKNAAAILCRIDKG